MFPCRASLSLCTSSSQADKPFTCVCAALLLLLLLAAALRWSHPPVHGAGV
jgi:hypothetical protein